MKDYSEKLKNEISQMVSAASELVTRIDSPEKIPDSCYRGDVSQWNFAFFVSKLEKTAGSASECGENLSAVMNDLYGNESSERKNFDRAVKLCRDYAVIYDLKFPEI